MAERDSKKIIYIAIACNVAIAACKYTAAIMTGSAAMMAEAYHSTADTGNELLLLLGMRQSAKPADAVHPYGHGKALYFYSFLVAVYIFGVGGGLSIHNGISHLYQPQLADHPGWNYAVLGFAAAFEYFSWRISYRELKRRRGPDENIWDQIVASKDPTVFTVFLEDSAGMLGAFVAFLGIFLGHVFHNAYFDPAASILIGVVLGLVAVFLGRESGALLVGERMHRSRLDRVRQAITANPAVDTVGDLLTMQLGPSQVLLTVDIQFRPDLNMQSLEAAVDRIEDGIRKVEPTIGRIFIEAESFRRKPPASRAA